MNWWDEYFGDEKRAKVPVNRLSFDRRNPRYTPDKQPANGSDQAIIQYLDRTADLGELVQSVAASGYIDIEPLIVMPRGDELVVLEGNRRLAALKSFLDPGLAEAAKLSVPAINERAKDKLNFVTAYKVSAEDEARDLIGFKHINGPQAWDSYAKALYTARWLDEEVAKGDKGLSLTDIAARMGDKHDTLYRIVSAAYVLKQAEDLELFQVEDRARKGFSFSHLYTALTYTEFRTFLGLGRADRSANPLRNPVDAAHHTALRTLLTWLYGSRSQKIEPAIKTQAPDLGDLKRVLGHSIAQKVMLERSDLSAALKLTVEGSDRFSKSLIDAQAALQSAVSEITNAFAERDIIEIAEDVAKRASFIFDYLSKDRSK